MKTWRSPLTVSLVLVLATAAAGNAVSASKPSTQSSRKLLQNDVLSPLSTALNDAVKAATNSAQTSLNSSLTNAVNSLQSAIKNTTNSLQTTITNAPHNAQEALQNATNNLQAALNRTSSNLQSAIANTTTNVQATLGNTTKVAVEQTQGVLNATNNVTQGARKLQQLGNLVTQNPVTTLAGAAIGSAQSAFNNATSGVRNAINETRAGVTNRTNAAVAEGQGLVGNFTAPLTAAVPAANGTTANTTTAAPAGGARRLLRSAAAAVIAAVSDRIMLQANATKSNLTEVSVQPISQDEAAMLGPDKRASTNFGDQSLLVSGLSNRTKPSLNNPANSTHSTANNTKTPEGVIIPVVGILAPNVSEPEFTVSEGEGIGPGQPGSSFSGPLFAGPGAGSNDTVLGNSSRNGTSG